MMVPTALAAAGTLGDNGIGATVLNVPVIKPLDADTIVREARASRFVITAENHSVIGGLGSAVAEALAAAAVGVPLHRIGIADVFAESGSRGFLFSRYGLDTQSIVNAAWRGIGRNQEPPRARAVDTPAGAYAGLIRQTNVIWIISTERNVHVTKRNVRVASVVRFDSRVQ
jgi:transketolase